MSYYMPDASTSSGIDSRDRDNYYFVAEMMFGVSCHDPDLVGLQSFGSNREGLAYDSSLLDADVDCSLRYYLLQRRTNCARLPLHF